MLIILFKFIILFIINVINLILNYKEITMSIPRKMTLLNRIKRLERMTRLNDVKRKIIDCLERIDEREISSIQNSFIVNLLEKKSK